MTEVLLYSGGLDSYVLNHVYEPDERVFFDIGTEEAQVERRIIEGSDIDVKVVDDVNLRHFALDNDIIPHRNTILTLLASNFGNQIYMGATKGDTTKDKDYVWADQTSSLMNYFGKDSHKVPHEGPFGVVMPFKENTKTEIVEKYLEHGGNPRGLVKESRSCYQGGHHECGECRSCLRKAIALKLNGVADVAEGHFLKNPLLNITPEDHEKMLSRKGESEDYERLLDEYPEFIPAEVTYEG